jgi:hypothetical protein
MITMLCRIVYLTSYSVIGVDRWHRMQYIVFDMMTRMRISSKQCALPSWHYLKCAMSISARHLNVYCPSRGPWKCARPRIMCMAIYKFALPCKIAMIMCFARGQWDLATDDVDPKFLSPTGFEGSREMRVRSKPATANCLTTG